MLGAKDAGAVEERLGCSPRKRGERPLSGTQGQLRGLKSTVREVEAEWARQLGPEQFAQLRDLLQQLVLIVERQGKSV
ncbi:MAG: hypothetical protein M3R24_29930 [Chloroflexota bacterium]|nr:hypothetical protein [Chloroflexota bacterium]